MIKTKEGYYEKSSETIGKTPVYILYDNAGEEHYSFVLEEDMPQREKEVIRSWLSGQTCGLIILPDNTYKTAIYSWDYERFANKLPVID